MSVRKTSSGQGGSRSEREHDRPLPEVVGEARGRGRRAGADDGESLDHGESLDDGQALTEHPVPRRRAAVGEDGRRRNRDWPPAPEPLPEPVMDNHTHLDIDDGEHVLSLDEQLARAAAVGVPQMVQIGCDLPAARWTARVVAGRPELLGGVAIHPNEAPRLDSAGRLDHAIAEIADLARSTDRIRVIGETGLDHFRTGEDGWAAQVRSFRDHIALAKELDLVLQIHDRDAHAEVLEVLAADGAPERTVFHCFSGDAEMARLCAERGWYLSFAGTVTFRNAEPLRAALRAVPLTQVLVETDAPFLTPHPYRGRPNAPYLLPMTVRAVAEIHGVALDETCRTIAATTRAVYGDW